MDFNIVVNDQIKYNFTNVKNFSFSSSDLSDIQILENHTEAFFGVKINSELNIELLNSLKKKFKIESEKSTIEIKKNISTNIVTIICNKIVEIE